jgi:tetratricopeptide (TPR) repeat protein/predicted Ser/Thr protein kinase
MPETAPPADADSRVGKFVKTDLLGSGGGGDVWKAWDTQLSRFVALKFVRSQDAEELERFRREAVLSGKLAHPNIAAVHEFGEHDGRLYIVMQYIDGKTLRAWPRVDRRELARFVRDAARAVEYAHARGFVHRDLKPENIMVTRDRRVYVMDFGMARAVAGQRAVSSTIVGTVNYMPPEQARGQRLDARADVYALGATLYEVLTGSPPYRGATVYETLQLAAEGEPLPPRRVDPSIDPELETIVLKCMERDCARRYPCAAAVADDLDRWLAGDALTARRASVIYRMRKRMAKVKLAILVGSVALAALAVVSVRWYAAARALERERDASRLREGALGRLGALWNEVALLKQGFSIAAEDPARVRAQIAAALEKVDVFVAEHPDWPQGYYVRARGRLYSGRLAEAEEDLRQALRVEPRFAPAATLLGAVKLEQHTQLMRGMRADPARGRRLLEEARGRAEEGRRLREAGGGIERWGIPRTREDEITETLVLALERCFIDGDRAGASEILRRANERAPAAEYCAWIGMWCDSPQQDMEWQSAALDRMPHCALAAFERGLRYEERGDSESALRDMSRAVAADPAYWAARVMRGYLLAKLGRPEESAAEFARAIELESGVADVWYWRARAREAAGDLDGAIADLDQVLSFEPDSSLAFATRAAVWRRKGSWNRVIDDATRALELEPRLQQSWIDRGRARVEVGDADRALADFAQAFQLSALPPDLDAGAASLAEARGECGLIRRTRGDGNGAIADFREAVRLAPHVAYLHRNLGATLAAFGQVDAGLAALDQSIVLDAADPLNYLSRAAARAQGAEDLTGEARRRALEMATEDIERALERAPRDWRHRESAVELRERIRALRRP